MFRLVLLLALALTLPSGAIAASPPGCPILADLAVSDAVPGGLPKLAAALSARRLEVLAIGSATVLGSRGRPSGSFADYMTQALRDEVPGLEVQLTVQGERGMGSTAMLAALRKELASRKPALVIWQTGTVEAVRKLPPGDLARDIDAGAEMIHRAGGELVLVDPQYSRMLLANADVFPYREAMRAAAKRNKSLLFSRFDLLHHWVEEGALDPESAAKPERAQTIDRMNRCLGAALAQAVLRNAGPF